MVKHAVLALLLCCVAGTVQARLFQDGSLAGRQLQQVNQRCPAGCESTGCVLDSTSGGYKCIKCQNALTVNPDDGTCGCPAGRFASTGVSGPTCSDCDKGSYCQGGTYTGSGGVPVATPCPGTNQLTTIGKRSTSLKACVNVPGSFYTADNNGAPSSTTCPVDTYGPGLRKQRACVPCPPGYTTNAKTGSLNSRACVVPEGYYLKGPGQVAPCPKGEYKSGFEPLPSCTKCAAGVSTASEASTSEAACQILLPTFYAKALDAVSGIISLTKKCPQKYFCPGGKPTAAFDVTNPTNVDGVTIKICADGTWTQEIGASSADQCMTPPGYKTVGTGQNATAACADGEYRADWKPAAAAGSCQVCGDSILSSATEQITTYDIDTEAPSPVYVRATGAACYIKPGQGMYFSAASNAYRAVNCETNQYGVANTTYGLAAFPCRDCPAGMQTSTSLATSNNFFVTDGAGKQGYTSPMACVTKAGYGYNGRVATKCPAGSYNAAGNYGTCTKCAVGLSTPYAADSQVSVDNCTIAAGYGFHDNAIVPCPVGTYNSDLRPNTTAACTPCDQGKSTSVAGGNSAASCDVCAAGWGEASCASQCGGSSGATFGPAGRYVSAPSCEVCPAMATGFSFDYLAQNQNFTPAAVARTGAESPADCLSEFAQIADAAWQMGGSVSLTNVTAASGENTFAACVANCKADTSCQYITFDYDTSMCFKKSLVAATSPDHLLAFKAVTAGDTTASSNRITRAKALSSGSYTFWKDSAVGVGADSSAGPVGTIQQCLSACDNDFDCAAVAMTSVSGTNQGGCTLIKGDKTIATFRRSVTKAVVDQLSADKAKA